MKDVWTATKVLNVHGPVTANTTKNASWELPQLQITISSPRPGKVNKQQSQHKGIKNRYKTTQVNKCISTAPSSSPHEQVQPR